MNLLQRRNQRLIVVLTIALGKRLTRSQFFEQVIHSGDGDFGIGGLDLFAMGVEAIAREVQAYEDSSSEPTVSP
jgi:hypothetical protein